MEDVAGDGADVGTGGHSAGMSAHHNGIDMQTLGFLQNHGGNIALDEQRLGTDTVLAEFDGQRFKLFTSALGFISGGEATTFRTSAVADEIGVRWSNMKQDKLGRETASPEDRFAQDRGGGAGEIKGG